MRRGRAIASERRERIGQLLEIYGSLLSKKQREYLHLHFVENKTFQEIADKMGVSRQAIHDVSKYAEQRLELFERSLGLLKQKEGNLDCIPGDELEQHLMRLHKRLHHQRVIYDTDWLMREIEGALKMIRET